MICSSGGTSVSRVVPSSFMHGAAADPAVTTSGTGIELAFLEHLDQPGDRFMIGAQGLLLPLRAMQASIRRRVPGVALARGPRGEPQEQGVVPLDDL
jgi:hypothetical protein